jgi:hypothetical protein
MKLHIIANKTGTPYAACAAKRLGGGKVTKNNRDKRSDIERERLLLWADAKVLADKSCLCANCVDAVLIARNSQRRKLGRPAVASAFD